MKHSTTPSPNRIPPTVILPSRDSICRTRTSSPCISRRKRKRRPARARRSSFAVKNRPSRSPRDCTEKNCCDPPPGDPPGFFVGCGTYVAHPRAAPKNNPSRFARRGGPPPYGVRPPAPRSLRAVGSPTTNCGNRLIVQPQVVFVRTHVVGSGCRPERCSRAAHSPLRFWRCGRAVRKDGGVTRENRRDGVMTVNGNRSGDGVGGMFHLWDVSFK